MTYVALALLFALYQFDREATLTSAQYAVDDTDIR